MVEPTITKEVTAEWLASARAHDQRVREIEKQWKGVWVEMADLCIAVRDNREWEVLGFHSWNAWLLDAAPCSRSMAYLAIGIREELSEFTAEDLSEMPLGNAEILKMMPESIRSREDVVSEAKCHPPREFRSCAVVAAANQHLEQYVTVKYRVPASLAKTMAAAMDLAHILERSDSEAVALEAIFSGYLVEHQAEFEQEHRATAASA